MNLEDSKKQLLWVSTLVITILASIVGSVIYPRKVYTEFFWQYLWGPVVADAHGVQVVSRTDGMVEIGSVISENAVTAEPGYTVVSTITYATVLIFFLIGIAVFSSRFELELDLELFMGLVPFMILGGLLRVTEDINTVIYQSTGSFPIPYPYNTLLISPLIYGSLFVLSLISIYVALEMERKQYVEDYSKALAGMGSALCVLAVLSILGITIQSRLIRINYLALFVSSILVVGFTLVSYYGVRKLVPEIHSGTESAGIVVVMAHTLDGVVNVLSLDWADSIGIGVEYAPKHVLNSLVRNITSRIQPDFVTELIGVTWPFLLIKIAVAILLVWTFDEEFRQDNRELFVILLLAATAVGLGPGSRDLTRMVLGI